MHRCLRPFGALVVVCLLLVAGCNDKHEPTKPTVVSATIRILLPVF